MQNNSNMQNKTSKLASSVSHSERKPNSGLLRLAKEIRNPLNI